MSQVSVDLLLRARDEIQRWVITDYEIFMANPVHITIEAFLLGFVLYVVFRNRSSKARSKKLSSREVDNLIDEWEPASLVPKIPNLLVREQSNVDKVVVKKTLANGMLKVEGVRKNVVNAASFDFLGFGALDRIKDAARDTLEKYGCGSCGPRGFYGTMDVHVELEQHLARFMGQELGIVYSDAASAVVSAIAAFAKRGDIIVADDGVNDAVRTGLGLSRSKVFFFKHNDMDSLRSVLETIKRRDKRLGTSPATQRRFIVAEGLYRHTGDLCPLRKVLELKREHKFRLMLDESLSFGVLGKTGRGLTEH